MKPRPKSPSKLKRFLAVWLRRLPGILVLSLLIHLLFLSFWAPHARTVMLFDKEEAEAVQEKISEREAERKALEKELRAKRELPEAHRDKLREEAERRERKQTEKDLEEVLRNRELALEQREEIFERMKERKAEDFLRGEVSEPFLEKMDQRLKELAEKVEEFKDAVPEADKTDSMRENENKADDLLRQATDLVEEIRENPESPDEALDQLADVAQEIRDVAAQERHRGTDTHEPSWALSHQGNLLKQEAEAAGRKADDAETLNDTSSAEQIADVPHPGANAGMAEQYDTARQAEIQTEQATRDVRAAELAIRQNETFARAKSKITDWSPDRPDLAREIRENETSTVGDLNAYRESVRQAASVMSSMAVRTATLTGQMAAMANLNAGAPGGVAQPGTVYTFAQDLPASLGGTGAGSGIGDSSGGGRVLDPGAFSGTGGRALGTEANLPRAMINANALPGRKFTEQSARQGWLYVDTWYHIGPWANRAQTDFKVARPPEQLIDFDAEYHDGKFADSEGHEDQVLRWRFLQSDGIRIEPLRMYGSSTYFFYTEVYFDKAREMIVSIAADDAAKLWINGEVIVDRPGESPYMLGELLLPITFQRGTNTLLVRLENAPGPTLFSVLLTPRNAVEHYLK